MTNSGVAAGVTGSCASLGHGRPRLTTVRVQQFFHIRKGARLRAALTHLVTYSLPTGMYFKRDIDLACTGSVAFFTRRLLRRSRHTALQGTAPVFMVSRLFMSAPASQFTDMAMRAYCGVCVCVCVCVCAKAGLHSRFMVTSVPLPACVAVDCLTMTTGFCS